MYIKSYHSIPALYSAALRCQLSPALVVLHGRAMAARRRLRCLHDGCAKGRASKGFCIAHGGGQRCQREGCDKGAQGSTDFCSAHGGGQRCQREGCPKGAGGTTGFCEAHGGGQRCQTDACSVYAHPPPARYKQDGRYHCWGCFTALYPEKARLKVRKEHYVLAELERLIPELAAFQSVWDCPVPGGCSLKRPDKLYVMADRYMQFEVDERGHASHDCFDEDARLEIIAADVGLPGVVVRLDPDSPPCFRRKRLRNGEYAEQRIPATFERLLRRAEVAARAAMTGPPPAEVHRVFVSAGE